MKNICGPPLLARPPLVLPKDNLVSGLQGDTEKRRGDYERSRRKKMGKEDEERGIARWIKPYIERRMIKIRKKSKKLNRK